MFFLGTPEEGVQTVTNHEEAASIATIVSITANLALLLAKKGKRVTLADLDVGGADIHILFGLMNPPLTLTDFLNRRVDRLEDIAQALPVHSSLTLIPGTGDTLATANMSYAKKKRLIRHLHNLQSDVVIVDIGAGASYHALDFFLVADHHVTVATPDPTSVLNLYRFIKLAASWRRFSREAPWPKLCRNGIFAVWKKCLRWRVKPTKRAESLPKPPFGHSIRRSS
jgi:cellulose biosynthesis protein BcsQ